MVYANIMLGENVQLDPSSSINNIIIGNNVRIAKHVSAYGGPNNLLEIGANTYIGMNCILNGFSAKLTIGKYVSFAQNVNIMVDSGPNASSEMQKFIQYIKRSLYWRSFMDWCIGNYYARGYIGQILCCCSW